MPLTTERFIENVVGEFNYRKRSIQRSSPVEMTAEQVGHAICFKLSFEGREFSIIIPAPYEDDNGNIVVGESVIRCVGDWQIGASLYDYLEFMQYLLCNRVDNIVEGANTMSSQIARLIKLNTYANPSIVVRGTQRIIDTVVNSLPLSESPMKDYFMNRRVTLVDPKFNGLNPKEKLRYQIEKQKLFFPWTSKGLADGSAATNNYLLKDRIELFTPFQRYNNPQRNLYSTLGMKWDEIPLIMTRSEDKCKAKRTGRNLVTLLMDDPENFEDQIILSERLRGLPFKETRRIVTYGKPVVFEGEKIETGRALAVEPNGSNTTFDVICDYGTVNKIIDTPTYFNGKRVIVKTLVIEVVRGIRNGFKITNRHGNKGVITFANTGYAINPETGEQVPIDIIVSAKSVGKRRNSGQVLEAVFNNLIGNRPVVMDDALEVDLEKTRATLMARGYPKDLTCEVHTFRGQGKGIVGKVFWGFIKTVEDQIWTEEDLADTRSNGIHRAGLKLSPIEFKALCTIFGEDRDPVFAEILSHASGKLETLEHLYVLRSSFGIVDEGLPKIHVKHIKAVQQADGYFQDSLGFKDTIADVERFSGPFLIELPFYYYTVVKRDKSVVETVDKHYAEPGEKVFSTKYIYVPGIETRKPWMHQSGLLGMAETTTLLNNVVDFCNRPESTLNWKANALTSIRMLFHTIATRMSSKRGWLNQNILSIRYPKSSKAVATQNSSLPKNWVGIHKSMADQLKVKEGDYVIVERFPCLGFPSMRLQRIHIHEETGKEYVIEVSGNSLVSLGLDFDGDVIYIMAFDSEEANAVLQKHFHNPNPRIAEILEAMNAKVEPQVAHLGFDDYGISVFPPPSKEYNAEVIENLAGVKLYTGPVIAMCYNLLRIMEPHIKVEDPTNVSVELLLDRVANSVFSKKHGTKSLQEETMKAICLADEGMLMTLFGKAGVTERSRYQALGIKKEDAKKICDIIRMEAKAVGVRDLAANYEQHVSKGQSNVISLIVRKRRKTYFATRASLNPYLFLEYLYDTDSPEDLVASLMKFRIGENLGWNLERHIAS
jgi:hypothetical protein